MEYKIFGPGSGPSEYFRENIAELAKLNASQMESIADWFLTSTDYNPYASPLPGNIAAGPLLPEQFQSAALAVRGLLYAWQEYGLELADIERDLLLVGVSPTDLAAIAGLVDRLSPLKKRAWVSYNLWVLRQECLPTLDELNFVCEARAVFGGVPSGNSKTTDSYKQFLGTIPIVIMELATSDGDGNTKRISVELPEEQFEWLRRAVARAHEQFSMLKE